MYLKKLLKCIDPKMGAKMDNLSTISIFYCNAFLSKVLDIFFKVAEGEANTPDPPPSSRASTKPFNPCLIAIFILHRSTHFYLLQFIKFKNGII